MTPIQQLLDRVPVTTADRAAPPRLLLPPPSPKTRKLRRIDFDSHGWVFRYEEGNYTLRTTDAQVAHRLIEEAFPYGPPRNTAP